MLQYVLQKVWQHNYAAFYNTFLWLNTKAAFHVSFVRRQSNDALQYPIMHYLKLKWPYFALSDIGFHVVCNIFICECKKSLKFKDELSQDDECYQVIISQNNNNKNKWFWTAWNESRLTSCTNLGYWIMPACEQCLTVNVA